MFTIVDRVNGESCHYSIKAGRDIGNPIGGWSLDINDALQFAREKDAQNFRATFLGNQMNLNVVSHG